MQRVFKLKEEICATTKISARSNQTRTTTMDNEKDQSDVMASGIEEIVSDPIMTSANTSDGDKGDKQQNTAA